ncbi:MAG TPA: penicillin-binding transpeptidase domain-containing protein, partial [Clostridia bacterium]|nr:penicillin-binding transpeptidase domain-containing protein [Clostridia bacterium]
PECSIVVLDNATGELRAVVGGREHTTKLALNRATASKRQPGSTIKPLIVYGPAIESGFINAATPICDELTNFNGYIPKNFNDKFNGWVTVRQALAKSLNIPAVKVLQGMGIEQGKSFAESLGIEFTEDDNHLALALGGMSIGTTPAQIANAYQAFANDGVFIEMSCIRRITNNQGITVYVENKPKKKVMSEETAFLINDMLVSAVEEGTGGDLKNLKIQVAAKTGTVGLEKIQGYKDAWMVSYNAEYTVVAHLGFDKTDAKNCLPPSASGSTYPGKICGDIFRFIYKGNEGLAPKFHRPSGIVTCLLDKKALYERHSIEKATDFTPYSETVNEYFSPVSVPQADSVYWNIPATPTSMKVELSGGKPLIKLKIEYGHIEYKIYKRTAFGESQLLGTLEGNPGEVQSITDNAANPGDVCEYYCVPYHKEIQYGNQPLRGEATDSISIVLPYIQG